MERSPLTRKGPNNLDGLRLLFAIAVIYSHSYPLTGQAEILSSRSRGASTIGELAVAFFFILSGYLITASWQRRTSAWDYFKKRCARILPGYTMACVLTIFFVALLNPVTAPDLMTFMKNAAVGNLIESPRVFASNPLPKYPNGSLWTIRYEFICYIGLAMVGAAGGLKRMPVLILLGISSALLYLNFRFWTQFGFLGEWPRFVTFFLGGSAAYLWRDRLHRSAWIVLAALVSITIALVFGKRLALVILLATLGTYSLLWLGFARNRWRAQAGSKGDLSYGTYLYAFLIQQIIVSFAPGIRPIALFFAATPLTLVAALLSWHLVEKRFLARTRKASDEIFDSNQAPPLESEVSVSRV
jgi:peptidoglycan/LPS O-acetylase OafA/YrhL